MWDELLEELLELVDEIIDSYMYDMYSDGCYSVPEEEEPEEQYSTSPSPPTRPGYLTFTDESGSLCPTVESPVRLEPHGLGKSERG